MSKKKEKESSDENAASTSEVPEDVRLWLEMMKYLLECGEMSTKVIAGARQKLDFSKRDLEKFQELDQTLDKVIRQMTSVGQSFCKPRKPVPLIAAESSTQSLPIQKKSCNSQTNDADRFENKKKRKSKNMDACLCGQFAEETIQKSTRNKISICSTLARSKLLNYKCDGCSSLQTEGQGPKQDYKDLPNDDNHPNIIKNNGKLTIPQTGVGYEMFSAMHRFSDRIAQYIHESDETITFSELLRLSISCAIKLKSKNLNEDSIICLCVNNIKHAIVPYISGFFIGSQMNAYDVSFSAADIAFLMKLVRSNVMFLQIEMFPMIEEIIKTSDLQIHLVSVGGRIEGYEALEDYFNATEEEIKEFRPYKVDSLKRNCVILFSSGTGGMQKGVCLSHENVLSQSIYSNLTDVRRKLILSVAPLFWISAVIFLVSNTIAGCPSLIAQKYAITEMHKFIEKYKVDVAYMGPYEAYMLCHTQIPPDADLSSLKAVVVAGAKLKLEINFALRKIVRCLVFQKYGLTEISGLAVTWSPYSPDDAILMAAKPDSCGRPFGGFWYKIVEEETERILGPNQTGELRIKSDTMIMNGYYHQDSSDCFDSYGWFKTGDLVYYDDHHCFFIIDRIKELIRFRQLHVPPAILETVLMSHPAVFRAVVIGIPHLEDGEHPMGLILLRPGVDPATVDVKEVAEFVNKQVDDRKQLRAGVRIIDSIPLTSTGKVQRRILRDNILNEKKI